MRPISRLCLAVVVATINTLSSAHAKSIIRDTSLFETLAIEGVSLATPPREAVDLLFANGYTAGNITSFDEWGKGSLNFVLGSYGGPEGISSVTLGRADGRLAMISQSLNRRGLDPAAEINHVQSHFGIAADEPDCKMNAAGVSGSCQVRDAEDGAAATMVFSITAQSTMILRSVSRPQELTKTLE